MAMFENEGFCPNNSFGIYQQDQGKTISPLWERTSEILGDRKGYMVYSKNGCAYRDYCYIVDALVGATGTLGIEVATTLRTMIPCCEYLKAGRKIICTDLVNPYQIPASIAKTPDDSCWYATQSEEGVLLMEDERYLIALKNAEEAVYMWIYQK